MTTTAKLRNAPGDWKIGLTRVVHNDGQHGTFVRNSYPLPDHTPNGWLGVLIRFDGERDLVDVDPADLTVTCLRDPFAAIGNRLPTRYAPGATGTAYNYGPFADRAAWYPVVYYAAGVVIKEEGPIWLVEPYPAERVEGSDGLDPIDSAGIAVVRGDAAPRPRGTALDGDWIIPAKSLPSDCAYDVHVSNQRDALAAWVEAWAIAAALNNKKFGQLGIDAEDIEVLLAAERRALTGPALGEATYTQIGSDELGEPPTVVPREQMRALVGGVRSPLEAVTVADNGLTVYGLSVYGVEVLTEIRRAGAELAGPRCRECGCTPDRACGGGCSWITLTDPAGPLCSVCPDARRR